MLHFHPTNLFAVVEVLGLALCRFVGRCQHFRETCCLTLQGLKWQGMEIEGLYRIWRARAEGREPIRGREYGKGMWINKGAFRQVIGRGLGTEWGKRWKQPFSGLTGEHHVLVWSRFMFPLVANERLVWPTEGESILLVDVVGIELNLYHLADDLVHVSWHLGQNTTLALKMETACFSETLALTYKSTWCQNPRVQQQHNNNHCENLKSRLLTSLVHSPLLYKVKFFIKQVIKNVCLSLLQASTANHRH
jgi:hypothetical protein